MNKELKPTPELAEKVIHKITEQFQIPRNPAIAQQRLSVPKRLQGRIDAARESIRKSRENIGRMDRDAGRLTQYSDPGGVKGSGEFGDITLGDRLKYHRTKAGQERRQEKKDLGLRPDTRDYSLHGGGYDYDAMRRDMEERGEIPASRRGKPRPDVPDTEAQAKFRTGSREQNLQTAAEIMQQIVNRGA